MFTACECYWILLLAVTQRFLLLFGLICSYILVQGGARELLQYFVYRVIAYSVQYLLIFWHTIIIEMFFIVNTVFLLSTITSTFVCLASRHPPEFSSPCLHPPYPSMTWVIFSSYMSTPLEHQFFLYTNDSLHSRFVMFPLGIPFGLSTWHLLMIQFWTYYCAV